MSPTRAPHCSQYKEKLNVLEAELQQHRNNMALGYTVGVGARLQRQWLAECAVRRCLLHSLPGAIIMPPH